MRVKVCGNRSLEAAEAAVAAGADMLGFIMAAGSPRTLTPRQARDLVRRLPGSVDMVGVFVDDTPSEVAAVAAEAGFTAVQLHGAERWVDWADFDLPVLKAVRLGGVRDALALDWPPDSILLADARHERLAGGTGRQFEWDWAQDLAARYRLVVSGGLDAASVGDAIRRLQPWGVDASSRLESSPGVKDPALVTAFVAAARRAEAEVMQHA
jgi:phosphoribosylanthranilate isomerase